MYNDTISDLLTRIRNAYMAKKSSCVMPYSKFKHEIAKMLISNEYLKDVVVKTDGNKKDLEITLLYKKGEPAIKHISRVSRASRRVYYKNDRLPHVLSNEGIAVISTSKGIMNDKDARKQALGGEIICKVW